MSIGKNTVLGMLTDAVVFGLGIVVSVILTRSFGPAQRGIYVLLITTNILLANISHLSLGTACRSLLAHGQYRLGQVHTIVVLLALGLGMLCFAVTTSLVAVVGVTLFAHTPYNYILIALLLIPTTIYQIYWNSMMLGLNRVLVMNQFNLALNTGNALLMIVVVGVFHGGIPGFLAVWLISSVIGSMTALVIGARMDRLAWPPDPRVLYQLLSFGLRGHGAQIAHQLFLRFDLYVVSALIGTAGVGIYSVATALAEKLWIPFNGIYTSSISKIAELPPRESALLTAKVTRTAVLLISSAAIPFALISPWLVPFMYGAAFQPAVLPLLILLVGTLSWAAATVITNYILGQLGRPGLLSAIAWAQLGLSIPLYLGLIFWQGIVGAALASTITYILALISTLWIFQRNSHLAIRQILVPQRSDLRDYGRVLRRGLVKVPILRRYTRYLP